ncbi:hypothetical protein [Piscinibacterium candidicorallinum]|uniref:Uncharacterized protein n=1 Tax=Piscinibacterium candidicorallinum TaxID=1793872 RepID=A0ABV7H5J9_9BURK
MTLFRADGSAARTAHSFSLGSTSSERWGQIYTARRTSTPGVYSDYRTRALWLVDSGAVHYLDLDQPAQSARRVSTLRLDSAQTAFCGLRVMGSRDITDPLSSRAIVSQAGQDARCDTQDDAAFVLKASQTATSQPLPVPALARPGAIGLLDNPADRASKQDWLAWLADGRVLLLNDDLDTANPTGAIGGVVPSADSFIDVVPAPFPSSRIAVTIAASTTSTTTTQLVSFDLATKSAQRHTPFGFQQGPSYISADTAGSYVLMLGTPGYWPSNAAAPAALPGIPTGFAASLLVPVDGGVIAIGRNRATGDGMALLITQAGSRVITLNGAGASFWYAYPAGNLITVLGTRNSQSVILVFDRSGSLVKELPGGQITFLTFGAEADFRTYNSGGLLVFARPQAGQLNELVSLSLSTGNETRLGMLPPEVGAFDIDFMGNTIRGRVQVLRMVRRATDAQGTVRIADDAALVDLETPNSLRRLTNNINF